MRCRYAGGGRVGGRAALALDDVPDLLIEGGVAVAHFVDSAPQLGQSIMLGPDLIVKALSLGPQLFTLGLHGGDVGPGLGRSRYARKGEDQVRVSSHRGMDQRQGPRSREPLR